MKSSRTAWPLGKRLADVSQRLTQAAAVRGHKTDSTRGSSNSQEDLAADHPYNVGQGSQFTDETAPDRCEVATKLAQPGELGSIRKYSASVRPSQANWARASQKTDKRQMSKQKCQMSEKNQSRGCPKNKDKHEPHA